MTQLRVGFVGDSITNGTGDATLLGWTLRLGQAERARGHDVTVYNLGIRADTSKMVAARFEGECAARLQPAFDCATVFAVGINDSANEESDERQGLRVAMDRSVEIIAGMAETARRFGPVLWVGPTPVVEAMMPLAPFPGLSYDFRNRVIADYGQAYAARAAAIGVPYLDLHGALKDHGGWRASLEASDGLHPTTAGYQIMCAAIGEWDAWRALLD